MNKPWYVYMLKCSDGSYYTGVSTNVFRRVEEHKSGGTKASKYVRSRLPCFLAFFMETANRSDAQRLEAQIKKLSKKKKHDLSRFYEYISVLDLKIQAINKWNS